MRAAYVCFDGGVPVFGYKGSSIHVQEVLRAFSRAGVRVDLFAPRMDGQAPADLTGIRVHRIPVDRTGDAAEREQHSIATNHSLSDMLNQAGPFDFIYERYSLWTAASMEFAARRGIPGILEVNAPLIDEQIAYRELVDRSAAQELTARAFASAAAVVSVSRALGEYAEALRGARSHVYVIPNGVDPNRFPRDVRPARPAPGVFTIGFLGSLKPWHGLFSVVDGLEALARRDSRLRFLVVGDGPARSALERELSSRRLASLTEFTGAIDPTSVAGLLASMDVGVIPYPETGAEYFSPLKLFECMAAGLPVVASAVGQVREIIVDGSTGLLYQPGDTTALISALERLRIDVDLRKRIGVAARTYTMTHHTWEGIARRILAIVRSFTERTMEKAG